MKHPVIKFSPLIKTRDYPIPLAAAPLLMLAIFLMAVSMPLWIGRPHANAQELPTPQISTEAGGTAESHAWTNQPPPADAFGAEPAYIAVNTEGPAQVRAPLSSIQITGRFGVANLPGRWVWRRIDADTREGLLGTDTPAGQVPYQQLADENEHLKLRIENAVRALNGQL